MSFWLFLDRRIINSLILLLRKLVLILSLKFFNKILWTLKLFRENQNWIDQIEKENKLIKAIKTMQ